jgi:hypothetical protein
MLTGKKTKKELEGEVDLISTMVESLVELLEEKGVLTQKEWERRTKEKVIV